MVYVLLGTGFEEMEAITPVDLLRRAGIGVITVGLNGKIVLGSHRIPVHADITIDEMNLNDLDMVVLPGGLGGVASIKACPKALDIVRYSHEQGKFVAAICAAPTILAELGITAGKEAVCYPGCEAEMGDARIEDTACLRDGNVITGASAGCAIPFALELIAALRGAEAARQIREQIVIR